jgi:hypothetical protein
MMDRQDQMPSVFPTAEEDAEAAWDVIETFYDTNGVATG